jgi:hypothetical protein
MYGDPLSEREAVRGVLCVFECAVSELKSSSHLHGAKAAAMMSSQT